jgi:sugar phosphate isomerase/epimerase
MTGRLSFNQITCKHASLRECVEACARHGVGWIAPWREPVAELGLKESARLIRDSGLRISSLCRGGFFPAPSQAERRARIEENLRAIDEAAELGAPLLVLVCGAAPDRDLDAARAMVARGIEKIADYARQRRVRLGIEPLHPMFAADRSVIVTLGQALDLAEPFDPELAGVILDVFHLWWDPRLYEELRRASGRIFGLHVSDWAVPLPGIVTGRSMMGEGVIEIRRIRRAIDATGYSGPIEVEIMNEKIWAQPIDDTFSQMIEAFRACVID